MKQRKTAYLALYEAVRQEITEGTWPYGTRLPSRRQMARDRGVSVITVEHSVSRYSRLRAEVARQPSPKRVFCVFPAGGQLCSALRPGGRSPHRPVRVTAGKRVPFFRAGPHHAAGAF